MAEFTKAVNTGLKMATAAKEKGPLTSNTTAALAIIMRYKAMSLKDDHTMFDGKTDIAPGKIALTI